MIYLASPFTSPDKAIEKSRHEAVLRFTMEFIKSGYPMFSPIVYGYPFFSAGLVGSDYKAWQMFNDQMIWASAEMWVLKIEGWDRSAGIAHEIKYAQSVDKRIIYVEEDI